MEQHGKVDGDRVAGRDFEGSSCQRIESDRWTSPLKKRTGDDWFPFWIDKWIFGSTRDELTVEQCAVWVDFLALSYKDEGFIRANEGMPYPIKRLSGILNRSEKLIQSTIDRCLEPEVGKLKMMEDGTLYVISHPEYELSKRHKRRLGSEDVRKNGHGDQKTDTKNRVEESRGEENRKEMSKKYIQDQFETLLNSFPSHRRGKKEACFKKFNALVKAGKLEEFRATTVGYFEFLKDQKLNKNFNQEAVGLHTWLNNWEGDKEMYLGFKYEPKL